MSWKRGQDHPATVIEASIRGSGSGPVSESRQGSRTGCAFPGSLLGFAAPPDRTAPAPAPWNPPAWPTANRV